LDPDLRARLDEQWAQVEARFEALLQGRLEDANPVIQPVLARLRAGQLSRKHLSVLARVIAAQLDVVEIGVTDATAARESDVNEVRQWMCSVATASEHGQAALAEQAQLGLERSQRNLRARDVELHEWSEFRDRLVELGRLVLEAAG
jgi:hypothetical protein